MVETGDKLVGISLFSYLFGGLIKGLELRGFSSSICYIDFGYNCVEIRNGME